MPKVEPETPQMLLADFDPVPTLVTEAHQPERPLAPAIDAHNHTWGPPARDYVATMDRVGVERMVILDGAPGAEFARIRDEWAGGLRARFSLFTNAAWDRVNEPDFPRLMPDLIAEAANLGADGLKVPKALGLGVRTADGRLYPVDHERFDPIWARCADLGLPVIIPHTSAGVALLLTYGARGPVGALFKQVGVFFTDHLLGVAVAMCFVSVSYLVNSAREAIAAIHPELEQAALVDGASPWGVFWKVTLPLAQRGITNGALLMWARGISEFGAVVLLAYHPRTLSVLVYERFQGFGLARATPLAALLVIVALIVFAILSARYTE